jgi:hypothetical protein
VTSPSAPFPTGELERAPALIDRALVEELLRLFGKAARAHQLYLPNNPIYKAAQDALRAGFAPIWERAEELVLSFTESEVKFDGETVLEESTKSSDSLPWIFYKDGVREVTFLRGFDAEELPRLLTILQRIRKASPDEDDLLTMLWEGDFVFLRYRYVDLTVEASVPLSEGGEALRDDRDEAVVATEEEPLAAAPSGVVNMADFDATLYFLDDREIEYLQSEARREYATDLRQNVVCILLDIFEQQPDIAVREEVVAALDTLMLHMLSAGQFRSVAFLVREALVAAQRAVELLPMQRDRLTELPARLSAPDALTQLLQSLDESPELPPVAELLELFEQLRGGALETVLDWLGRMQNARLRPLLEQVAGRLAAQNTADLVKLVLASNHGVALEAIKRAGALRTPAAVAPIAKVLVEGDAELRINAVTALTEIGSPSALQALERAVEDGDRDVRIAAIRALQSRAYRPVLPRLEAIVKGKTIRDADLTEKMAVFEAYGSLCGDPGVAALDATLNGKSLFGRREDGELRACAAVALGRVNTPAALESLRKATNEKDVVVRNAVNRALRGGQS